MDKRCKKCGEVKLTSEFHKNGVNGLRANCKTCENCRDRKRYWDKRPVRSADDNSCDRDAPKIAKRPKKPPRTRESERARFLEWKAANPEREKARQRRYLENNRAKLRAKWNKRRADRLRATPPWADLKAIEAVYAEAARLTSETGVQHQVDHIVPLRGRSACGLHVHWNLRPIPASENAAKLNREEDVEGVEYLRP